ncbi:MAG: DNRLRE domain-containing protein [Deltaproteobacteria bacterium]|nr:DNRLRE domain-containing protein [Deltaproteobacteria bacterium]
MVKSGFFFKVRLIFALLLTLTIFQANPGLAKVYTIPVHADAFVESQNPDTNYGGEPDLYVQYFPEFNETSMTRRAYLKFDMSGIPPGHIITAAKLYLFVVGNGGHPPPNADLYHVGDGWTGATITWNTQPPTGNYLATQGSMFWGEYYAWNLFESGLWQPAVDLADKKLSLLLKLADEGPLVDFAGYIFSSNDSPDSRPYLEVTAVPPTSSSINLLLLD